MFTVTCVVILNPFFFSKADALIVKIIRKKQTNQFNQTAITPGPSPGSAKVSSQIQ